MFAYLVAGGCFSHLLFFLLLPGTAASVMSVLLGGGVGVGERERRGRFYNTMLYIAMTLSSNFIDMHVCM